MASNYIRDNYILRVSEKNPHFRDKLMRNSVPNFQRTEQNHHANSGGKGKKKVARTISMPPHESISNIGRRLKTDGMCRWMVLRIWDVFTHSAPCNYKGFSPRSDLPPGACSRHGGLGRQWCSLTKGTGILLLK